MSKTVHAIYVGSFFLVGIAVTILLAYHGYHYYSTPIEERFFVDSHDLLKPSGDWGHGFGIIGTLMMILGVAIYMVRKRVKGFFNWGYVKHWLEFHIFLCSVGPVLVLYHTAFKFGGIVSVSFWSMAAVVASGVVGRFIYLQIPRTIQGKEIGVKDLNNMSKELTHKLETEFSINGKIIEKIDSASSHQKYREAKTGESIILLIKDFFDVRLVLNDLKKELNRMDISKERTKEVLRLSKQKLVLARRIGLLRTMQRFFKYWHIFHLPFAITMFVIMLVHVAVTIIFGYKWIF